MQSNLATSEAFASCGFTIDRATLLSALSHVQSIVEKRNTIPVLSNVKIDISSGVLKITATDMDVSVSETISLMDSSDGSFTTPAHMFYEIVRKLPEGSSVAINYASDSGNIDISAGNSRFTLPTLPASEFPEIGEGQYSHTFTMSSGALLPLFEKTKFAMSNEETRYFLNGIYFHVAGEESAAVLRAVSTDGHRLARYETAIPSGAQGMPSVIVPRKAVGEFKKLFGAADAQVTVSVSANKIKFTQGSINFVSKLIDGTYPDYNRVIPIANDKLMEVDPKLFSSAVDRVSTVSSDKVRGVKISAENGKLTLSANNAENSFATDVIDVSYSADKLETGFNARYLLEVLDQVEGDVAQFVFSDPVAPTIVRDTSDVGALYVIMPMRI